MKYIKLLLLTFTLGHIITSCEKSPDEIFDDITVTINPDFIEYSVQVQFIDAADPAKTIEDLSISILGANRDAILESSGEQNFEVIDGRTFLTLKPELAPSGPDAQIFFQILAEAPGYLPVNTDAFFDYNEKDKNLIVTMINTNNPPEGVGYVSTQVTLEGNELPDDFELTLDPGEAKATGATLVLEEGTQFKDAAGSVISGSNLQIQFTHFDPFGDAALNAYPGGFTPESVIGASGSSEDIVFDTAGFASINMQVNGTKVKEFTKPLKVIMDIDEELNMFNTDTPLKSGDQIPVWSYEIEDNTWQFEKNTTIEEDSGKLSATFTTTHLSWYNLDFYGSRCRYANPIKINAPNLSSTYFYIELVSAYTQRTIRARSVYLRDGQNLNFRNCPNFPVIYKVYSRNGWYNRGDLLFESDATNLCAQELTITIPPESIPTPVSIDLTFTCSDKNFAIKPSYGFYYKEVGTRYWNYAYMTNGKASSSLIQKGDIIEFWIYIAGRVVRFEQTVGEDNTIINHEIDAAICDQYL